MNFSIILTLFVGYTYAVHFRDCGSEYDLQKVDIEGCTDQPCEFKIGQFYNVSFTFNAGFISTNSLSHEVYFIMMQLLFYPPVEPDTPCKYLNCPIQRGTQTVKGRVFVETRYLPFDTSINWKILDSRNEMMICWMVPGKFIE